MASGAIDTDRGVSIFLDQDFAEDNCPAVQVDHDITLGTSEASPKASVISVLGAILFCPVSFGIVYPA